jgi:hypothetical protein
MKLPNENEIAWNIVKPSDFRNNLSGGEFKPHDVEIIVKYKDGSERRGNVKWELIKRLNDIHGVSAIQETYETILELT